MRPNHIRPMDDPTNSPEPQGFSLLELLIALTIFAVGILAVAAMQTASMRGGAQSTALTQAVRGIVQDKAEELIGLPYDDSDLDSGGHGPANVKRDGVTYSLSWNVTLDDPYPEAKNVTVTTNWDDLAGNHTVSTSFIKDEIL
jgi:type IV pilus assembly protein PilV